MFSILHITDLHRSSTDPLSNPELLSAMLSDRDRYVVEDPPIRAPDAIVVSGDLIQGVTLGATDHAAALAAQYDVAHRFIADLTERFLGGDRSRVVIVPGNHDIDCVGRALDPAARRRRGDHGRGRRARTVVASSGNQETADPGRGARIQCVGSDRGRPAGKRDAVPL